MVLLLYKYSHLLQIYKSKIFQFAFLSSILYLRSSTQKLDTNKYVHVNYNVGALQRYVFHLVSYSINIQYLYFLQKFLEISTKNDSFEKK